MKKLVFLFALTATMFAASGQSFFKPIPKVTKPTISSLMRLPRLSLDSTMNAIRPIISLAAFAYSKDGSLLMSGAGVSWQHLKYNYTDSKWDMQYGFSAVMWANGAIAPTTSAGAVSAGLNFHFLNYGSFGAAYNFARKEVDPMIGFVIPLN